MTFGRYQPRPAKQMDYTPKPRVFVLRKDAPPTLVVPIPKGEKAKPGKRPPTREEAAWMDAITALGCIACRLDGHYGTPGAVHHILRGGVRMGHLYTICLCDPGHHQNGGPDKISRHPWKTRFEDRYGSEALLLEKSRELVKASISTGRTNRSEAGDERHF